MGSLVRQTTSDPPGLRPLSPRRRLIRLAPNAILLLLYAAAAYGQIIAINQRLAAPMVWRLTPALELASHGATLAFIAMQFTLVIVRRPALRTAPGTLPILVTVLATGSPILLVWLPPAPLSNDLRIVSLGLLTIGMATSTIVVARLGRSFSLLPQARGLVVSGPYKRLRHPLYAAELVATLGVMMQFVQPWASMVFAFSVLTLIPRMNFEEQVLAAAFPAYGDYVERTWRLIPGIY